MLRMLNGRDDQPRPLSLFSSPLAAVEHGEAATLPRIWGELREAAGGLGAEILSVAGTLIQFLHAPHGAHQRLPMVSPHPSSCEVQRVHIGIKAD